MAFLSVITATNISILLITLVLLLYLYFKWSYTYWNRRGVITPPCSFPFGNLKDVVLGQVSFQEMFKKSYIHSKQNGIKYFGYYFLNKPMLVVLDREIIKSIMVKDFSHFTDHGLFEQKDYDPFSGHLFASKGTEWKKMREKLTPLFTSGKLKIMFSTIANCSNELASLIHRAVENVERLNIQDIAGRYTTDAIASVGFGIESNSLKNPNSDFFKYGKRATGNADTFGALNLVLQSLMPDLVTFFKIPLLPSNVTNFFLKIVESTIKYREENNIVRKDFMQLMIQLKNNIEISDKSDDCFNLNVKSKKKSMGNKKEVCALSIQEIVAQTILFFAAGYDTSSITITFCMYELAFHQDIQERLRNEIKSVLSKNEGELSYKAIMEMTYMEQCIKETLRKYSVLSNLFRRCTKSYQIPNSNLVIEKDMLVLIPIQELHYDPEYYPNPEQFDPERFMNENISNRPTITWLPFGEGPRLCIGARLAMIQIKIALTTLLKDFQYSLCSRTAYPLKKVSRSMIIAAEGGVWLNVEKVIIS